VDRYVSNAFRLLGSGELVNVGDEADKLETLSQMPFGFWVLGNSKRKPLNRRKSLKSLKCLSAFGFWGTENKAIETLLCS